MPPPALPPIYIKNLTTFFNSHEKTKKSLFLRGNLTAAMSTAVLTSRGFLNNRFRRESFGSRPPPPLKKPLRSPPRRKPKPKPSPPKKPSVPGLGSYGEGSPGLSSIYAGPAYSVSPEPSSLPFPAVFVKSEMATRRLRCLLRLDAVAA